MKRVLKKSLASVSQDDRKIIRRISTYLLSHHMNEVVYEETVSDLIGMAEECRARGEDFSQAIGPDIEGFSRELIKNAPRMSWPERVLADLQWFLYCFGMLVPVMYIVNLIFTGTGAGAQLTFTATILTFLKYCVVCTAVVTGIFIFRRRGFGAPKLTLGIYIAVFVILFTVTDSLERFVPTDIVIHLDVIIWVVTFGVLLLLCWLIRRLSAMTTAYMRVLGQRLQRSFHIHRDSGDTDKDKDNEKEKDNEE